MIVKTPSGNTIEPIQSSESHRSHIKIGIPSQEQHIYQTTLCSFDKLNRNNTKLSSRKTGEYTDMMNNHTTAASDLENGPVQKLFFQHDCAKSPTTGVPFYDAEVHTPLPQTQAASKMPNITTPGCKKTTAHTSKILYLGSDAADKEVNDLIRELIITINEETSLNSDQYTPIKLHLNAFKMDFYDMWALIDIITTSPVPIYTYCVGHIMGNVFPVFLAGNKRFCYTNSSFTYVPLEHWNYEKYADFDEDGSVIHDHSLQIIGYILSRTSLVELNSQKTFYPHYAKNTGIVHEIL